MDVRKHLIIIKGKDQTDSVASFQFHDGKCEVVYTSAPNKTYSFQSSNEVYNKYFNGGGWCNVQSIF